MANPELDRLESAIGQLSFTDQLWLMDRLAQRIRERSPHLTSDQNQQLEAMAGDPAIRRELQEIEVEFAQTEHDGLGSFARPSPVSRVTRR
jgi:hypothetical protein